MTESIVIFLLFVVVQVVSYLAALLFSNLDKLGSGAPLESLTTQPVTTGLCLLIGEALLGAGLWYYFRTERKYRRFIASSAQKADDEKSVNEAPAPTTSASSASAEASASEATVSAGATDRPSASAPDPSLKGDYLFSTIKRHLPERPISWQRGTLYVVATVLLALLLGEVLEWLGVNDDTEAGLFKGMLSSPLCLLLLCFIGPWAEEMTFRQGIVRALYRRGLPAWASAVISALAFAVVHGNLAQGIPALIIGTLLGLLYLRTGNLRLCLTAHVINNVVAAVVMAFF